MNTLALLGRNSRQLQLLKKTNLDPATLAEGAAASPRLSAYLAQAEVARDKRSVVVQIRSKVYAYLKQAMDEIRACAHFAFATNPSRRKGYTSEYYKRNNDKARKQLSPPQQLPRGDDRPSG